MEFTILPDNPSAARIMPSTSNPSKQHRVLRHHSGRPWIIGQWSDDDIVLMSAGKNRAALLGATIADDDRLVRLLRSARTAGELDVMAGSLPGCFHFIASIDGLVRAQGSLSTACQIFHGSVHGVTVAADRPQTVAALAGTGIDEQLLTLQLLSPYGPPWPLTDECLWRGVHSLLTGHYLTIRPDGSGSTVRWWSPREPDVPPEQGAVALRQTLVDAVDARSQHGGTVSADLSGGMDSTSLCYLADCRGVPLVTVHYEPLDSANDDSIWAKQCETKLRDARHLVVPRDAAPEWYAESRRLVEDIEGPYPFGRSRPTVLHLARLVAGTGSTRHLLGIGADELFQPSSRRRQRGESYARWLASTADRLTVPWTFSDPIYWEIASKLPSWTTSDAVQTVRRLLQTAAGKPAQPLCPIPVRHEMMRLTLMNGAIVRRMSRAGSRFGVSFHAPYLDDRVLEAVLAIRPSDRTPSSAVKPSLAAAMRGIAPDDLLDRKTKGPATHEGYACRRRWNELPELCDDSRLAGMGIIDAAVLRAALNDPPDETRPPMPRDPTRACELWLRELPAGA